MSSQSTQAQILGLIGWLVVSFAASAVGAVASIQAAAFYGSLAQPAWHQGALALADITVLWLLIAATIITFWRVRPLAGALLVPYFLWVSFAFALNYSVWQLNPQVLGQ